MRTILIPAKPLNLAKMRLGQRLTSSQRASLARAMYLDVLKAAMRSQLAEKVAVVSADAEILGIAEQMGAVALNERFPRGLNAAVKFATVHLEAAGTRELAVVLSDIPLVTPEDIDELFLISESEKAQKQCVILVPSADGTGTNMILRRPPSVIKTRFGRRSLTRHIAECRLAGVQERVVNLVRPSLDLDVPNDLFKFLHHLPSGHTARELSRLGLSPSR